MDPHAEAAGGLAPPRVMYEVGGVPVDRAAFFRELRAAFPESFVPPEEGSDVLPGR